MGRKRNKKSDDNTNLSIENKEKKSIANMDLKDLKKYFVSRKKSKHQAATQKEKKRSVVAFDIGTKTTKIVEGKYYKGKLVIDNCKTIKTPEHSIEDGEIKSKDSLTTMIGAALRQYNIKAKDAICTTNSTAIISREILIPKVEKDEIETVARYEIQQYLPIDLNDCVLQMSMLGEVQDELEEKTKLNVRVISYPKGLAHGYFSLLSDLGLRPYVLDVNFNALNKLVNFSEINKIEDDSESSIMLLDMGEDFIDVNIYKGKILDFTRRIKAGGRDIDERLISEGSFPREEVTVRKFKNIDLLNEEVNIETSIAKEVIDDWIEKIEMILRFYKNKSSENNVNKAFIFGGSSRFNGLSRYMSERLAIPVDTVKKSSKINFKRPGNTPDDLSDYVNAIGSIIRL